jgi:hypothetical protein
MKKEMEKVFEEEHSNNIGRQRQSSLCSVFHMLCASTL